MPNFIIEEVKPRKTYAVHFTARDFIILQNILAHGIDWYASTPSHGGWAKDLHNTISKNVTSEENYPEEERYLHMVRPAPGTNLPIFKESK